MLKYTILYKNGKTWNGKAEKLVDVPVADCVLMTTTMPVAENSCVDVYRTSNNKWKHSYRVVYAKPKQKKRTPNPNSKTKKQKAFDEAYVDWAAVRLPEVYIWGSGHAEYSIQAYKKWLWEQKNDSFIPWHGGEMPVPRGTMVHVKLRSGKEVICTAGYHPSSKQFKRLSDNWLYATDWSHDNEPEDIVAYRVYDEELKPSDDKHINFPSGASISWKSSDDIFLSSYDIHELSKLKPGNYKIALYTSKPPIKTTYTFWLGANGEIVDDK